jgi:FkbM family methyltransferase
MSKFSRLKANLGFWEAAQLYVQMRNKGYKDVRMKKIEHPFTLRKNPYDYVTFEEVLLKKSYELPAGVKPARIIDGGGNIGLTAVFFANRFPEAKIITVEPDKDNFELLSANCSSYKNITCMNAGIWNRPAHLTIIDQGHGNNAFTVEEVAVAVPGSVAAVSIESIRQSQQWDTIDVVKLDIEGSEKQVFEKEYESWLPRTKVLFIELHDRMVKGCSKAVFAAMSKYDFNCEIAGENLLFVNTAL